MTRFWSRSVDFSHFGEVKQINFGVFGDFHWVFHNPYCYSRAVTHSRWKQWHVYFMQYVRCISCYTIFPLALYYTPIYMTFIQFISYQSQIIMFQSCCLVLGRYLSIELDYELNRPWPCWHVLYTKPPHMQSSNAFERFLRFQTMGTYEIRSS